MSRPKILLQLDTDAAPSVFDSVVAVDAGAEQMFRHGGVTADNVEGLVHGLMFTRGPEDLRYSAIFLGGSDVPKVEAVLAKVRGAFFGPLSVSVMIDPNGANTTAAAAVLAAAEHVDLAKATVLVLAATGPVGQRVVRLLARQGATVRAASRDKQRAEEVCGRVSAKVDGARLTGLGVRSPEDLKAALDGANVVIAAGAAGIELVSAEALAAAGSVQVSIDLNAVPPLGIGGIKTHDRAKERDGKTVYGAIGVGATKMKIHKAAIRSLFEANDRVLDAEELYDLGETLGR